MFVYRSGFLKRGEVWYDDAPNDVPVDWVYYRQRSLPLSDCKSKDFYTVLVNLQRTPEEMRAHMDAKTVRRISEAEEKDKLRCEPCDSRNDQLLDEVEQMWNAFALAQNTPRFERDWVDQMRWAGALDVVAAKDPAGQVLAYHLVFLTPNRARQLVAISPYKAVPSVAWRNTVSRANCLIHWYNFSTFRDRGIRDFDFGGWYPGTSDIRLLGINRFKKSFGGVVVQQYDCERSVSLKGRVLLAVGQRLTWFRRRRPAAGQKSACKEEPNEIEQGSVSRPV